MGILLVVGWCFFWLPHNWLGPLLDFSSWWVKTEPVVGGAKELGTASYYWSLICFYEGPWYTHFPWHSIYSSRTFCLFSQPPQYMLLFDVTCVESQWACLMQQNLWSPLLQYEYVLRCASRTRHTVPYNHTTYQAYHHVQYRCGTDSHHTWEDFTESEQPVYIYSMHTYIIKIDL